MQLNKSFHIFYTVATLVLMFLSCDISAEQNLTEEISLDQAIQQQLAKEQDNPINANLKRKRRYLEFPDGSSFQLVYDLIVGVVDYTNYLILGVTVALAWELPSKPPSEIFDDLAQRLQDGTLGTSRNDTVNNIKYVDLKKNATKSIGASNNNKFYVNVPPIFKPPMHHQYYVNRPPDSFYRIQDNRNSQRIKDFKVTSKNNWRRKNNYFYSTKEHPFTKWTQNKNVQNFNSKATKYPWWNLPTRLKNSFGKRPSSRRFDQAINRGRQQTYRKPVKNYKNYPGTGRAAEHRIFPIFGKRSIDDIKTQNTSQHRHRRSGVKNENLTKLDRIHIQHHRNTRHDLYERIETYLDGRGSNGHHCVLRALCETGQKSHERTPGSFVGEIMRAIFTLPESVGATGNSHQQEYKAQRYDTANSLIEDCASRYHLCKESLWSSHFVA